MGNGGTAKCPVQFTQGLGRAAGIPGQVEATPSGFCCLQIKTTETSANQIQSSPAAGGADERNKNPD